MKNEDILFLKPIVFTSLEHFGESGPNMMSTDYYLSKLIVQNVLYLTFYEPKSIQEIANILDVHLDMVEEIVYYLEANAFIKQISYNKYIATLLIHDFTEDTKHVLKQIYSKYAKIFVEYMLNKHKIDSIFIDSNKLNNKFFDNIYFPNNDYNFLNYSLITLSCLKFDALNFYNAVNFNKYTIRRTDGSAYFSVANVESDSHIKDNTFRILGQHSTKITSFDTTRSLWRYNTKFDDRFFDGICTIAKDFKETYDYIDKKDMKIELIDRLINNKFLAKDKYDNIFTNVIFSKLLFDEINTIVPSTDDDFKYYATKLADDIFNACKMSYPEHMRELAKYYFRKAFTLNEMITAVINHFIDIGFLKNIDFMQRKTVNMIIFGDKLPVEN